MATSTCVKCGGSQFETKEANPKGSPFKRLRHTSNRSRACRNGNWKMASRDWRRKATSPHLTFQNLPARDSGAPAKPAGMSAVLTHREIA